MPNTKTYPLPPLLQNNYRGNTVMVIPAVYRSVAFELLNFYPPPFAFEEQGCIPCVLCVLRTCIARTQSVRLYDQTFVCFANLARVKALAISQDYSSRGLSTRTREWGHIRPMSWQHHGLCLKGYLWVISMLQLAVQPLRCLFCREVWWLLCRASMHVPYYMLCTSFVSFMEQKLLSKYFVLTNHSRKSAGVNKNWQWLNLM